MIIIDCEQGSPEWFSVRLGIPTASKFNKIITSIKLEASKSAENYINKLIAEWLIEKTDEEYQSEWMKRGHEIEEEARDYYEFTTDAEIKKVGFCFENAKRFGCSPDALINEKGGLEIKCPSAGVHVGYLIANKVPTEYRLQILGSLLVTDREWWDFISYHPEIDALIVRTHREDVVNDLNTLKAALIKVNKKIYDKQQILIKRGFKNL